MSMNNGGINTISLLGWALAGSASVVVLAIAFFAVFKLTT
jgi:hypothetical protein